MNPNLRKTPWNRMAVLLQVPRSTGVFLLGAAAGCSPQDVMLIGSARNLRARLLELLRSGDARYAGARAVHWVAGLTVEEARIAERLFVRRYDPPDHPAPRSRYLDILAG